MQDVKSSRFFWLTLATASTTLVCCALPALFITLGAGAALASLLTAVPQLVWISQHKLFFFGASGLMLLAGGIWQMRPASCPADKALAMACQRSKQWSRTLYGASLAIYAVAVWAAFLR